MTIRSLLSVVLAVAISSAARAESITYDFTGIVTESSNLYASVAVGSQITGTYTFNLDPANFTDITGTVGSTSANWQVRNATGVAYARPSNLNYLFTSTASAGSFSYASDPAAAQGYLNFSSVTAGPTQSYQGDEQTISSPDSSNQVAFESFMEINGVSDYGTDGLPLFTSTSRGDGKVLDATTNSVVLYTISSVTAVPIPGAFWLLVSGIGTIGAVLRVRRRVETSMIGEVYL
jgi:hypothetical protein